MKTAFLFPGQGSQHTGMLHTYDPGNEIVKAAFEEFERITDRKVTDLDAEKALHSTVNTQLGLLLSGVISARRLVAEGIRPDYVAGHSVGAFAAAVICGALEFKQALTLVGLRSGLMEAAFPHHYGMMALLGFSPRRLLPYLLDHNTQHPPVYVANINAAHQLVISGQTASMTILTDTLRKAGLQKATLLHVAVPSHCELLTEVSARLKECIGTMAIREPAVPYAANTTGRLLKGAEEIRKDLWSGISKTVQWYDATNLIYEMGARIFIEMSPSGVLAKIADASFAGLHTIRCSERRPEETALLWDSYQQIYTNM